MFESHVKIKWGQTTDNCKRQSLLHQLSHDDGLRKVGPYTFGLLSKMDKKDYSWLGVASV